MSFQVLEENWREYLYIACVRFTKQVKKGPLQETSPLINDISGVTSWEKVGSVPFATYVTLNPKP